MQISKNILQSYCICRNIPILELELTSHNIRIEGGNSFVHYLRKLRVNALSSWVGDTCKLYGKIL